MSPTAHHLSSIALLNAHPQLPTVARLAVAVAVVAVKWDTRARTRKSLSGLEPHMLRDIGLTPSEARIEADKRFYQR